MSKHRNMRRRRTKKRRKSTQEVFVEKAKVTPQQELVELEDTTPQLKLAIKPTTAEIPSLPPKDRTGQSYKDWYQYWVVERNVPEPPPFVDENNNKKPFERWRNQVIGTPRRLSTLITVAGYRVQNDLGCPHGTQTGNTTWFCRCPLCYPVNPNGRRQGNRIGSVKYGLHMPIPPETLDSELLKFYVQRPPNKIPGVLIEYLKTHGYVGPATSVTEEYIEFSSNGHVEYEPVAAPTEKVETHSNGEWMEFFGIGIPKKELQSITNTADGFRITLGQWVVDLHPKR